MLKKSKSILAIILVAVLLINADPAGAVSFTDVNRTDKNSWAYDYIIELANKNIINGYEDGSYRPAANVSYLEVLKLIDGVVAPSQSERTEAKNKYGKLSGDLGLSDWARPAVELALYRNISNEAELKAAKNAGFLENSAQKFIDRRTISILMARALELTPKENPGLSYKDAGQINSDDAKLISALIDTSVLHRDGRDGYFEGSAPVKRSEVAKMFKFAYDWVAGHPLKGVKTESLKGEIVTYLSLVNSKNLVVEESNKNKESIILDSNTKVFDKDGKELKLEDLEKLTGAQVLVEYRLSGSDKFASKVTVESNPNVKSGEIYLYQSIASTKDKDGLYEITISDLDGKNTRTVKSVFDYMNQGNRDVKLSEVAKNTRVKLQYLDGKVVKIDLAEPEYEIVSVSNSSIDLIRVSDKEKFNYFLSSNVKVTRDGKDIYIKDIRVGDRADISLSSSTVTNIDIFSNYSNSLSKRRYTVTRAYPASSTSRAYIYVTENSSPLYLVKNLTSYYDGYSWKDIERLEKNSLIDVEFNKDGEVTRVDLVRGTSYSNPKYFERVGDRVRIDGYDYYITNSTLMYYDNNPVSRLPDSGYASIISDRNNYLERIDVTSSRYSGYYDGQVLDREWLGSGEYRIKVQYKTNNSWYDTRTGYFKTREDFRKYQSVKVYLDSIGNIIDVI